METLESTSSRVLGILCIEVDHSSGGKLLRKKSNREDRGATKDPVFKRNLAGQKQWQRGENQQ